MGKRPTLTTAYTHELPDGSEAVIDIEFTVTPGSPMTFDYPGDPAEVDFIAFTCKANPAYAEDFSRMIGDDNDLSHRVEEVCFEHAHAVWELSQCDD